MGPYLSFRAVSLVGLGWICLSTAACVLPGGDGAKDQKLFTSREFASFASSTQPGLTLMRDTKVWGDLQRADAYAVTSPSPSVTLFEGTESVNPGDVTVAPSMTSDDSYEPLSYIFDGQGNPRLGGVYERYDSTLGAAAGTALEYDYNYSQAVVWSPLNWFGTWVDTTSFSLFTVLGSTVLASGTQPRGTYSYQMYTGDESVPVISLLLRKTTNSEFDLYGPYLKKNTDGSLAWVDAGSAARLSCSASFCGAAADQHELSYDSSYRGECRPRMAPQAGEGVTPVQYIRQGFGVAFWCADGVGASGDQAYQYSIFRSGLGWQKAQSLLPSSTLTYGGVTYYVPTSTDFSAHPEVAHRSVDLALDRSGKGWAAMVLQQDTAVVAAYPTATQKSLIVVRRFQSISGAVGGWQPLVLSSDTDATAGVNQSVLGSLRLFMRSDGSGGLFYMTYDRVTGLVSLKRVDVTREGAWGSPVSIYAGSSTSDLVLTSHRGGGVNASSYRAALLPQLAQWGDEVGLAFTTGSPGGIKHLRFMSYSSRRGGWSSLVMLDDGLKSETVQGVGSFHVAAGPSPWKTDQGEQGSEFVVAYEGYSSAATLGGAPDTVAARVIHESRQAATYQVRLDDSLPSGYKACDGVPIAAVGPQSQSGVAFFANSTTLCSQSVVDKSARRLFHVRYQ